MSGKRTDFRALRARREAAIARPELRANVKPAPLDAALVQAAITKIPTRRTR